VFQSSSERPFAMELLEHNIWLEGQVNKNSNSILHAAFVRVTRALRLCCTPALRALRRARSATR